MGYTVSEDLCHFSEGQLLTECLNSHAIVLLRIKEDPMHNVPKVILNTEPRHVLFSTIQWGSELKRSILCPVKWKATQPVTEILILEILPEGCRQNGRETCERFCPGILFDVVFGLEKINFMQHSVLGTKELWFSKSISQLAGLLTFESLLMNPTPCSCTDRLSRAIHNMLDARSVCCVNDGRLNVIISRECVGVQDLERGLAVLIVTIITWVDFYLESLK